MVVCIPMGPVAMLQVAMGRGVIHTLADMTMVRVAMTMELVATHTLAVMTTVRAATTMMVGVTMVTMAGDMGTTRGGDTTISTTTGMETRGSTV